MIDVVPRDVVVALARQVEQVGAAIAPYLYNQRVVKIPIERGFPFERFL